MYNQVTLVGNLGKDPEMRESKSNSKLTTFTLATSRRFKGKDGEWSEKTEWHKVVCFGHTAEYVNKSFNKGDRLFVSGEISYHQYEGKDGEKRISCEIIAQKVIGFAGKKQSEEVHAHSGSEQDDDMPF